jgi:hypothetical protein
MMKFFTLMLKWLLFYDKKWETWQRGKTYVQVAQNKHMPLKGQLDHDVAVLQ